MSLYGILTFLRDNPLEKAGQITYPAPGLSACQLAPDIFSLIDFVWKYY
jgi:hypothetical protein